MKTSKSIKLKAAFLLMVFALNTVIAFACSMGLNMGYNKKHHHNENEEIVSTHSHSHSNTTKPNHHHKGAFTHSNDATAKHSINETAKHQHKQENSGKDDCCNKNAIKFQQVDKSHSYAAKIQINTPVILLALQYAYNINLLYFSDIATRQYRFVPPDPPLPDIRIAIQSFQI